jgi:drug/metabolite transporter (DMT)-like permease
LNEPLGLAAVAGMAVTLAGIAWVALERGESGRRSARSPHYGRGIALALAAAIFQAAGVVLAKLGIGHARLPESEHLNPWSASLVRMAFGAICICALAPLHRAGRSAAARGAGLEPDPLKRESEVAVARPPSLRGSSSTVVRTALALLVIGTLSGPVFAVWCSLVAIDRADAGVAATLMAMTPVFILPFAVWIERERLSWRAIVGAAVAVGGVAILTLARESTQ